MNLLFIHDGTDNEVITLQGNDQTFTDQMDFNYQGGTDAHYSVDRIGALTGDVIFTCDQEFGRMVLNEGETFKVVSSSIVLGAIANGNLLNMKQYLLGELINHFIGFDPPTSVAENGSINNPTAFPNPFTAQTTITFSLNKASMVNVAIFNAFGKNIKTLHQGLLPAGNHRISWDATDGSGKRLSNGVYYFMISEGSSFSTGKIIVL